MRTIDLTALLSLATAACAPRSANRSEPAPPIGLEYDGTPQGYEPLTGFLIEDTVGGTNHGLQWVRGPRGEELWLERQIPSGLPGHPRWSLRDVMPVPALAANEQLVLGVCAADGEPDPALLAVAVEQDQDSLRLIRRAWRADPTTERFEEYPAAGVVCENEGWGA